MMEEFQQTFFEDARDLLKQLEQAILTLENDPHDQKIIEEIFRVMHTIKGAANMFGFERIGEFTHDIETIYDFIRNKEAEVDEIILNITLQSVDHVYALLDDPRLQDGLNMSNHHQLSVSVREIIAEIEKGNKKFSDPYLMLQQQGDQEKDFQTYYLLIRPNEKLAENSGHPLIFLIDDLKDLGPHLIEEYASQEADDVRVFSYWDIFLATDKSEEDISNMFIFVEDACEIQLTRLSKGNLVKEEKFVEKARAYSDEKTPVDTEELKAFIAQFLTDIRDQQLRQSSQAVATDEQQDEHKATQSGSIRVSTDKVDQLMNWVSELVTMQATIQSIAQDCKIPRLIAAAENMEIISNNLRDTVFSISLLPLDTVSVQLKRLVRTLSKELGKEVDFKTEGADTELDKNVIEALTDPLMHMLRNCMDHGLETPEERLSEGKPQRGYILLKAYYSGTNVFIEVHDDGRGIDPEKIKAKAVEKGLIADTDELSRQEVYDLLFRPGFSTASKVTDVSGRGVGMDVVKKKIMDIRGDISIYSEVGKGTTISIRLPLTLSIMDGLLTQVEDTYFVFPLNLISRIDKVPYQEVNKEGKFSRSLLVEGKQMSVLSLREAFRIDSNSPEKATIVSIQYGESIKGIVVDKVKGEMQAVLKPLGSMYEEQDYISGSTILGDGNLALVLDTNKLLSRFAKS
jgi:two-component system chemotaxis sensor kinase CheA